MDFAKLWDSRTSVLDDLRATRREADRMRDIEAASATRIQCSFRGSVVRGKISRMDEAVTRIQKIQRGFAARRARKRLLEARKQQELDGLREHCAVLVQKVFRGAHSRKYKHDFYARKGYIEEVGRRSEAMRRELQESKEAQIAFLERKAREKADKEFETLAQNFHHLVSTAAIPGVFNPPFAVNSEIPTAFGVPLETHLRVGVKTALRKTGFTKSLKDPPAPYTATRESLKSQGLYGSEILASRQQSKEQKLRQLNTDQFKSGGTTAVMDPLAASNYRTSVSQGTMFVEHHLAARGMRDLLNSQELKGKRVSDAPFQLSVPKGVVFEDMERARSREAADRGRRLMASGGRGR